MATNRPSFEVNNCKDIFEDFNICLTKLVGCKNKKVYIVYVNKYLHKQRTQQILEICLVVVVVIINLLPCADH